MCYYKVVSNAGSYTSANKACALLRSGSALAKITSAKQNKAVAEMFGKESEYIFGLHKVASGQYEWADGTAWHPSSDFCYDPGWHDQEEAGDCVRLVGSDHDWNAARWDDFTCNEFQGYACGYSIEEEDPEKPRCGNSAEEDDLDAAGGAANSGPAWVGALAAAAGIAVM